jgi:outer membrane protein
VLAVERQVRESVTTAWNALNAARAQAGQYRAQITANDIALNDTRKEVSVGTRTRLDTLNAENELFGSRVNLVSAEHDILLATFQLEVAAGTFVPSKLSLGVADYDPSKHRDAVSGKWWGTTPPTE